MAKLSDHAKSIGGGCYQVDVFSLFSALNKEVETARRQARNNK